MTTKPIIARFALVASLFLATIAIAQTPPPRQLVYKEVDTREDGAKTTVFAYSDGTYDSVDKYGIIMYHQTQAQLDKDEDDWDAADGQCVQSVITWNKARYQQ